MSKSPYVGRINENGAGRWGSLDEPIKVDAWRIEDGKVYWGSSGKPIRGADPATFRVFNQIWARDVKRIFVYDSLVRGADADSFEVFNELYARDKNRAYYSFGTIKGADPSTFHALDNGLRKTRYPWKCHSGFAADKNAVYHYTLTIGKPSIPRGADPSTFVPLECDYGIDATRVYFQHTRVLKAKPSTFRLLGLHYATDDKHVIYGNWVVEGADVVTFAEDTNDDAVGRDAFQQYQSGEPVVNRYPGSD